MNSNSKSSTFLVANFNHLISSIEENNYDYLNNNSKVIKSSQQFIPISNDYNKIGSYSLWKNGLDLSVTLFPSNNSCSNSSQVSSSSISPASSIESTNNGNENLNRDTMFNNKRKNLELPSKKALFITTYNIKNKNCNNGRLLICSFCKNNGESEQIYKSHTIKDVFGRISCPLLKIYKCPICGESGEKAHTITYCKKFKAEKRNQILKNLQ